MEARKQIFKIWSPVVIPKRITRSKLFSEMECMKLPHVVLPLRGKFKGEVGVDSNVVNIASESQSGLQPRWIILYINPYSPSTPSDPRFLFVPDCSQMSIFRKI